MLFNKLNNWLKSSLRLVLTTQLVKIILAFSIDNFYLWCTIHF